jgi:hypothetical protein
VAGGTSVVVVVVSGVVESVGTLEAMAIASASAACASVSSCPASARAVFAASTSFTEVLLARSGTLDW